MHMHAPHLVRPRLLLSLTLDRLDSEDPQPPVVYGRMLDVTVDPLT